MQKKFITNLAILIVMNLLVKPGWILVIEPRVQTLVGNHDYGEYFALFNFSFLLNIILDFGITNFNNKNIAQNNHLLSKHFSGLFVLKIGLAFIYLAATIVMGLFMGYDVRYTKLLMILAANQFLISMILYLRSNLLGLHLFRTDSIISVLDRFIMIIFCGLIIWTSLTGITMDIMVFVYTQTLSYIVTAIIAFIIVLRKTDHFKFTWNWPFSLMIMKKSFPFAILILLMTFYNRLDAVMIERILPTQNPYMVQLITKAKENPVVYNIPAVKKMVDRENKKQTQTGAEQAGVYAKAFRLLDAANMIAFLFSLQLLPVFSRMIKYKESIEPLVKLSFTLIITPAIIVAAGSFFYAEELSLLINGKKESAEVLALLMSCFVAIATTYIFGTLLTANGNLKQLNQMALLGICINITLNFILIPRMFAYGAAISSLITQATTAFIQILLAAGIFKFRTNMRLIITLILFACGVVTFNILSHNMAVNSKYSENSPYFWMLCFTLMCVASGIWAFVVRLISIKSVLRFIRYN
ncbi:MAG: oligosaccharide flippase family protein [Bacteroidia bacterium]|nr:oligosaccharide flippase family protein [Bacteroidia bacterium]